MKKRVRIDKNKHDQIYIFEGHMESYFLKDSMLFLSMTSGVEYFDTMLPSEKLPNYMDESKIIFIGITYLNLEIFGPTKNTIEIGEIRDGDTVLDYSGGWGSFGDYQVPTGFILEIVCEDIEIEFLI